MKPKRLLLFVPFILCAYGFLPVHMNLNKAALKEPNTALIHYQACGCPCPDASIKQGQLIIPDSIRNNYGNIYTSQINIAGNDPLDPYEYELATRDFIVTGKVAGADTVLCNPTNCEVVPVFKVDKWSLTSYYPRFWRFSKAIMFLFLFSLLVSTIGILVFVYRGLKLMFRRNEKVSEYAGVEKPNN